MLKIENVHAGYGDLKVLDSFSMEVNQGEVVSLVGSNGAGKTTLLQIISGLIYLFRGKIDEHSIVRSTCKRRRRRFGVYFAGAQFFEGFHIPRLSGTALSDGVERGRRCIWNVRQSV